MLSPLSSALDFSQLVAESTFHVSPGGNETYLCTVAGLNNAQKLFVNQMITTTAVGEIEQGGFIEIPTQPDAQARLAMAGGEFCGNATRAFAALLAQDFLGNRKLRALVDYCGFHLNKARTTISFNVEVSGVSKCLPVLVDYSNEYMVTTEVPVIQSSPLFTLRELLQGIAAEVVQLEGITHILINEERLEFPAESWEYVAKTIIAECNDIDAPAIGVIWYRRTEQGVFMNPVVYVRSINTLFYETSCGSGATALAVRLLNSQERRMEIIPPSRVPLLVELTFDQFRQVSSAYLSGKVSLMGMIVFSAPISDGSTTALFPRTSNQQLAAPQSGVSV
jgi:histidine racemase